MDKQLRIIAGGIVIESKLSKQAKTQMINFIQKEATDAQVKALLMDGNIVQLDEQAEDIVNDRFKISEAGGRVAKLRKSYSSMSGQGFTIMWALYRKIRSLYDNCTRRCGKYELNTTRRQHCMLKCKVEKFESQLAAAKKAKNTTEVDKASAKLLKAQAAMKKSIAAFKSQGAEE